MIYEYTPDGVCSTKMTVEIKDDGTVGKCEITDGCDGSAKAFCMLIEGMKAEDAIAKLEGITCGFKDTSCPDQLSMALTDALWEKNNG